MPAAQVIDLSPTYDEGWMNFGKGFASSVGDKFTEKMDNDILSGIEGYEKEQDAVKKLDLLDKAKGLSPKRKKQERENLFERAHFIQEQDRINREIKKAEGQEKINFIDKYYGQAMKDAAANLVQARKNAQTNPSAAQAIPQLQADYENKRKAWEGALRQHAPEGFFPAIKDEVEAEPNAQQESAAPQAQAAQGQAPIERATPDKVKQFADAVRNDPDIPKAQKPKIIEEYVREANEGEVPAKVDRLVREAVTGRSNIPPKPEEIKQLVAKDRQQKEKIKLKEPWLKERIKRLSDPKRNGTAFAGGADQAIEEIMDLYGVPEEEAVSQLLMSTDFDYIPQEEQEAVYAYWEQWMDTERQAVAATLDQLEKMNQERYKQERQEGINKKNEERKARIKEIRDKRVIF